MATTDRERAKQERRRGSAAGPHPHRTTKRRRTRKSQRDFYVNEGRNS